MSYITETHTSTAACFYGTCIEKTESGEFGGDGKDRREESNGTSETEVSGQPV